MSPSAYYCWLYERRLTWLGLARLKPAPHQNFPWAVCVLMPLVVTVGCLALITALAVMVGSLANFFFWLVGTLAATSSTFHFLFACLAWNQRAARQRATGASAPAVRPNVLVRWLLGPAYVLLIGVVTPFALLTAIENFRGSLRWREVRTAMIAKGEKLDIHELLGPPVPAEQNFGSLPLFADLFEYGRKTNVVGGRTYVSGFQWANTNAMDRFKVFQLPDRLRPARDKRDHRPVPLADWAEAFRAAISNQVVATGGSQKPRKDGLPTYPAAPVGADAATVVLTALAVAREDLESVCAASKRPHCRFPVHWEEGFNALLPGLAQLKGIQNHLDLRVQALIAKGDMDAAFRETLCALRVADLCREEPLVISQLVRIAQAAIATRAVWHGIETHRWTDAQLQEFQRRIAAPEYFAGMVLAFEGERNNCISLMDRWAANRGQLGAEMNNIGQSEGGDVPTSTAAQMMFVRLLPNGWIRQNQTALAEFHQRMIELNRRLVSQVSSGGVGASLKDAERDALSKQDLARVTPYNVFVKMLAPALGKMMQRGAHATATARCAVTGCALERFRLKHGTYPESLTALAPEFLPSIPIDPIDGQPLRYKRTADGLFRLWSVGADGKDNGGERSSKDEAVDWTWPY